MWASICACTVRVCVSVGKAAWTHHFLKSNSYLCNPERCSDTQQSVLSLFPPDKSTHPTDYHTHLNLLPNSSMSQAKVQASRTQIRFKLHSYTVAVLKNMGTRQEKVWIKILSQPFVSDLWINPMWLHSVRIVMWYFLQATQNSRMNTEIDNKSTQV